MRKWKDISGYEGQYQVSNDGQVRSLAIHCHGELFRRRQPLLRALSVDRTGYLVVGLGPRDRRTYCKVHRLVLLAFVGPCPPGMETRHYNGNRQDNRVGNLGWATHRENIEDRDRHGTTARGARHGMRIHKGLVAGEKNGNAKLTASQVLDIRRYADKGVLHKHLAESYGVGEGSIWYIANRRSWKCIPEETETL